MRVVAGNLGGRTLIGPAKRSREVRPTSDRARETLFALLDSSMPISGVRVLDLFSGTGALAIEAISRGADSAVLVDTAPAIAQRNADALGIANRCQIVRSDAIRYLERNSDKFGLILGDPPYRLAPRLEPLLAQHLPPHLAKYARVAFESSARRPLEIDLPLQAERRIGEALIRVWSER